MIDPGKLPLFPDAIVAAIYGSLTKDDPWDEALELLCSALGGNGAGLHISLKGPQPRDYLFAAGPKASHAAIAEFEARSARELLPMELWPGQPRVIRWSEVAPAGPLSEMLKRYDVAFSAVMIVAVEDGVDYVLEVARSRTDGEFNAEELALLRLIGDHFGRALHLRKELVSARITGGVQSDALDRLGIGAILISAAGDVTLLNKAARRVLADCDGLRISGGRIRTVDPEDDRMFQSLVKQVLTAGQVDRSLAMLIKSGGEGRGLNVIVSSRRATSPVSHRTETCALVFVRCSSAANDGDVEVLQQLFSFTRAEAKLALGLAKGKRLEDVEADLNITHNTARAHLRSMFIKADVNRLSELVHVLSNSLAPLAHPAELEMSA